jgi:hypothetical protein
MREFDAFAGYPEPQAPRLVSPTLRTIQNRIQACYRGREFYDGDRANGYGGMRDDGRWGPIADGLITEYAPKNVLQINAHKGFLVKALRDRGVWAEGTEVSHYATIASCFMVRRTDTFYEQPFPDKSFDLVIAASAPYAGSLNDAIRCLREIQRLSAKHAWVVLAAYEDESDIEGLMLLRYWFLTGTLILTKSDWLEVMKHAGYQGDYRFDTAKSLNLRLIDEGRAFL